MTIEWLLLFLSVLFTLMVARYLIEGAARWASGQPPAVLVLGVACLPVTYWVWAEWTPWRGVPGQDVATAVGAAVVAGGVHVIGGAVTARIARRRSERAFPPDEAPVGVGAVQVIRFRQAPDSEYLQVTVDDAAPQIGWVPRHADSPEARWDATLTRMGWQRATPWTPNPDGALSCEAISPALARPTLDPPLGQ